MYKEIRFWGLLLNCPSVFPRTHGFGVPFVLYTHVHNLRCRLPSRENAQTWKGQRKILKARWANLWRNTSDGVLRGKISVSWAIRPVSYPTAAATRDAPLERVMRVKRLSHFLFASSLFFGLLLFFTSHLSLGQTRSLKNIHCLWQTSGVEICGTLHWGMPHLFKKGGHNPGKVRFVTN